MHKRCKLSWGNQSSLKWAWWVREPECLVSGSEEICWRGRLRADYSISNDFSRPTNIYKLWGLVWILSWSFSCLHESYKRCCVMCPISIVHCSGSVVAVRQTCGGCLSGGWQYRGTVEEIMRIKWQQSVCVWQKVSCEDSVGSVTGVSCEDIKVRCREDGVANSNSLLCVSFVCFYRVWAYSY